MDGMTKGVGLDDGVEVWVGNLGHRAHTLSHT